MDSLKRLVIVHQTSPEDSGCNNPDRQQLSNQRKSSLPDNLTYKLKEKPSASNPKVKPNLSVQGRASLQLYQESFEIIVVPGQPFQVIKEGKENQIRTQEPNNQLEILKSHFHDQILAGRQLKSHNLVNKTMEKETLVKSDKTGKWLEHKESNKDASQKRHQGQRSNSRSKESTASKIAKNQQVFLFHFLRNNDITKGN